jgi:1,4-alpha-glucan branching enzyme
MAVGRFALETIWGTRFSPMGTRFRLWSPGARSVELAFTENLLPGALEFRMMERNDEGWWEITTDAVKIGFGYGFRVDGGKVVPDPAARAQVGDVHWLSRLADPEAFGWKSADWKGRPWHECVFYEMHVGTFTPDGTFEAIIARLDHLVETGITAIELLPIAQFAGQRGWGYDGVLLYCPHQVYGCPEGLKQLVDAAHERGLMVFLDVVYNHFGPDGNYLPTYVPKFFHSDVQTAWGSAIAYDEKPVREFMIENALYWLEEYRIDGLRLDAIDSIKDTTDVPLVKELAARVRSTITDRHVHITTEDDRNITWHIEGRPMARYRWCRASGTTTSTTLRTCSRLVSGKATTRTTRSTRRHRWPRPWLRALCIKGSTQTIATRKSASHRNIFRRLPSSRSSRTTTRSETGHSATVYGSLHRRVPTTACRRSIFSRRTSR